MKTSNYIIIAFFIFLFGGVFVLFLSAKIHQRDSSLGLFAEEKELEPFSVIVAEPGANFYLRIAEYPRISCEYQKPDSCKYPPLGIRNDTLFVFSLTGKVKPQHRINIYAKHLKSIVAKEKSYISLQNFRVDTLIVKLNNAVLDAFFDRTRNHNSSLSIQSFGSKVYLAGINGGNLEVQLNGTVLNSWDISIDSLYGTLANYSNLSMWKLGKINLEADSTSNYGLNK